MYKDILDKAFAKCYGSDFVFRDKGDIEVISPVNGESIAFIKKTSNKKILEVIAKSKKAFLKWRSVQAPVRGELIRLFGQELRLEKENLAKIITLESGKILQEALGEVQEIIDICDFAVGLSRQLYGLTMGSERSGHRLQEQWHPLGIVGVITAFNFPAAVFGWNAALAIICGNSLVWKPSEQTPLTSAYLLEIFNLVLKKFNQAPDNLIQIVIGDKKTAVSLAENKNIALVSATGSCNMGRAIAPIVAARLGKYLLELGGNNAMIVSNHADLDLAKRAVVFSAVGTCGQRCTTLRRLFVHKDIYLQFVAQLKSTYEKITIGSPFDEKVLVGPLINKTAYSSMQKALQIAKKQGGIITGGEVKDLDKKSYYISPAIVEINSQTEIVKEETFAPILYVIQYDDLEQAIQMQNDVAQGLSSSIFTDNIQEAEIFMSAMGSDCGLVNINIGPSGAEIGGAFGGEKDTGGGRESGSDAWKNYMRRSTNTINFSKELPLAQGIEFDV